MPWTSNWPAWNCAAPASPASCAATPRALEKSTDLCETIRVLGGEGAPLVTCGFAVAHADEHIQAWRGYKDLPGGRAGTELRTFDAALGRGVRPGHLGRRHRRPGRARAR